MVCHQLVKALKVRQLACWLCLIALAGCGGGEEVDFSKPTAQTGAGKKFTYPPPDSSPPPEADKSEAKAEEKSEQPADAATAKPAKPAGAVVRVTKLDSGDDDEDEEEDEDDLNANWRKKKYQLGSREQDVLITRRKVAFSPEGGLIAAIDNSGEVLVFETRYGNVRGAFELPDGQPTIVAVSEHAQLLVVGTDQGTLRVFELKDLTRYDRYAREAFLRRQSARPAYKVSEQPLTALQFESDGTQLLLTTALGEVQMRSVDKRGDGGNWAADVTVSAHKGAVAAVALSADGEQLATSDLAGSVKVWDAASGDHVADMQEAPVAALAICQTEDGFAVGRANGVLELWRNPGDENQVIEEFRDKNPMGITTLIVEPKTGLLAKGMVSGALALVDAAKGETLSARKSHTRPVVAIASAPERDRLISCGAEGYFGSFPALELRDRARRTDLDDADAINKPALRFRVALLSRQDDDEDAAGYTRQQEIMLASFRTADDSGESATDTNTALEALRNAAEADRDSLRESLEADTFAQRAASDKAPELLRSIETNFRAAIVENVQVALSATGDTVALAVSPPKGQHTDGSVESWDVPTGLPLRSWTTDRAYDRVRIAGQGRWLIPFPKATRRLEVAGTGYFDLQTGVAIPASGEPRSMVVTADAIVIGSAGRYAERHPVAHLYSADTMQPRASFSGFETAIPAIGVLPEGKLLLSVRERLHSRLVLMAPGSMEEEQTLYEEKINLRWLEPSGQQLDVMGVTDIAVSRRGETIVTHGRYGNRDYRFTIWKRRGGRFEEKDARGAKKNVSFLSEGLTGTRMRFVGGGESLAAISPEGLAVIDTKSGAVGEKVRMPVGLTLFDPTGQWLAVHDDAGGIQVYALSDLTREPKTFRAQDTPVMAMAFSGDGSVLATVGQENVLNVWKLGDWAGSPGRQR